MNRQQLFLGGMIAAVVLVSFYMVRPFLGYFLGAVVLAFILFPVQRRLSQRIGESFSALSLVLFSVLVAVVPLLLMTAAAVQDARDLADDLSDSEVLNTTEMEQRVLELTGIAFDIESSVDQTISEFTSVTLGGIQAYINLFVNLSIGISLTMFLMYYFLKDGDDLYKWVRSVVPLPENVFDELSREVRVSTNALMKNQVLNAVIQGVAMGTVFFLVGVPNFAFWTFVMIILAFVPMIGPLLVWMPAAAYLFVLENVFGAFAIVLAGYAVMILTNNVIGPLYINRTSNIHPAAVVLGVLGGLYLFGAPGLFMGPILMAVLKPAVEIYGELSAE